MIERYMLAFLLADTEITNVVGAALFPNSVPEQVVVWPNIVVQRISTIQLGHLRGVSIQRARVQVSCHALDYEVAKDLAQLVKASRGGDSNNDALNGFRGAMGDVFVQKCFKEDERDTEESLNDGSGRRVHRIELDFLVSYLEG